MALLYERWQTGNDCSLGDAQGLCNSVLCGIQSVMLQHLDGQIDPDDIEDWNNDWTEPDEKNVMEFPDLEEARDFYSNGDDIPAYRVIAGQLFEIKEETNG